MQAGNGFGAHAQLKALGAHQRRHLVGRIARLGVGGDGGATRIVAVKAGAGAGVQLGLVPGAKDQVELGAGLGGGVGPAVGRVVAVHPEGEAVHARAHHGAEGVAPGHLVFHIQPQAALGNVVGAGGGHHLPRHGVVEAVSDVVVLELRAHGGFGIAPQQRDQPAVAGVQGGGGAPVGLGKLVAVDGVVQEVGEVGKQVQPAAHHGGVDLRGFGAAGAPPAAREAVAAGLPAVGGVDGIEPAQGAAGHGALRNLVGGAPLGVKRHQRGAPAIGLGALAVAQHAVAFLVAVAQRERAVVVEQFQRVQHPAGAQRGRIGQQGAGKAVLAHANAGNALRQGVGVLHVHRAGGSKVALGSKERAFAVVQQRGEFGNQEAHVGPALAVRVAALVDQHAVDGGAQVGAMVQVEAAQVELVGLALAAVLADDQARHRFQQLARPVHGARFQLLLRHHAFVGGGRFAQHAVARAFHLDGRQAGIGWRVLRHGCAVQRQAAGQHLGALAKAGGAGGVLQPGAAGRNESFHAVCLGLEGGARAAKGVSQTNRAGTPRP